MSFAFCLGSHLLRVKDNSLSRNINKIHSPRERPGLVSKTMRRFPVDQIGVSQGMGEWKLQWQCDFFVCFKEERGLLQFKPSRLLAFRLQANHITAKNSTFYPLQYTYLQVSIKIKLDNACERALKVFWNVLYCYPIIRDYVTCPPITLTVACCYLWWHLSLALLLPFSPTGSLNPTSTYGRSDNMSQAVLGAKDTIVNNRCSLLSSRLRFDRRDK